MRWWTFWVPCRYKIRTEGDGGDDDALGAGVYFPHIERAPSGLIGEPLKVRRAKSKRRLKIARGKSGRQKSTRPRNGRVGTSHFDVPWDEVGGLAIDGQLPRLLLRLKPVLHFLLGRIDAKRPSFDWRLLPEQSNTPAHWLWSRSVLSVKIRDLPRQTQRFTQVILCFLSVCLFAPTLFYTAKNRKKNIQKQTL